LKKSARIKLVQGSKQSSITLHEVKVALEQYREMLTKTGQQLGWNYQEAAFPYDMEEREQDGIPYLLLKGKQPNLYSHLVVGVGREQESDIHYIQVVLPENATHGDKAKANEFCKYLAKTFKGELHLFNDRIMYYNERKG
jgi:hypothetical protein